MADRLDIFQERCEFIVAWDDEGCPGLALGERGGDDEHKAATAGAESIGKHGRRQGGALTWEAESDATKALRAARAAVKAWKAGKPWPDWAVKASAEGWKAPKGWVP